MNDGEAGRPKDCIQIRMVSLWEEGSLLALPWGYSPHLFAWSVPCGWNTGPEGYTWELLRGELFSAPLELLDKGTWSREWLLGGCATAAQAAQRRLSPSPP